MPDRTIADVLQDVRCRFEQARLPTAALDARLLVLAAAISADDGTRLGRPSAPKPQRLTTGPTVGSNAPCESRPSRNASAITVRVSSDTPVHAFARDRLNRESSESAR